MARWLACMAAALVALTMARFTDPTVTPEDRTVRDWKVLARALEARPGDLVLLFGDRASPVVAEVLPRPEAEQRARTPPPFSLKGPDGRPRTWELCDLGCARAVLADARGAEGGALATACLAGWVLAGALALVLAWRAGLGLAPGLVAGGVVLLLAAAVALNFGAPPSASRVLGSACTVAVALVASRLLRRRPVELEGA